MKTLIVYTSPTWPHCHTAKHQLVSAGIKFIERDVSADQAAASELRALGFSGVPAFKIDDQAFVGLDMDRILRAIDYKFINCPACQKKLRIPKGIDKLKVTCPSCQHAFKIAVKK